MPLADAESFRFGQGDGPEPTGLDRLEVALAATLEPYLGGARGQDHARAGLEAAPGGGLMILLEGTTPEGRYAVRRLVEEGRARVQAGWMPPG